MTGYLDHHPEIIVSSRYRYIIVTTAQSRRPWTVIAQHRTYSAALATEARLQDAHEERYHGGLYPAIAYEWHRRRGRWEWLYR